MEIYTARSLRGAAGSWSSGYDIALTQRRSPVRIRSSPLNFRFETYISRAANLFRMVRVPEKVGRGAKYLRLLEDPSVQRWHRNVARGSQITADVYMRRLGHVCATRGTSPSALLALGSKERRDFVADLVSDMEDAGRAGSYVLSTLRAVKSWL